MNAIAPTSASAALEFKGGRLTVMTLCVYNTDTTVLETQLAQKVEQAPGIFKHAPVIIDLQALKYTDEAPDVPHLARLLRKYSMHPIAMRGGNPQQQQSAAQAGLSLLPEGKAEKSTRSQAQAPAFPSAAKVVTHPVRSGQQVVAKEGDLVILSMVSTGAEILAEGNIHVYGALRGRALAGVSGNTTARIFCQHFDAELVAVAGQYRISEDYGDSLKGKPVQVYLQDESLLIEPFGT